MNRYNYIGITPATTFSDLDFKRIKGILPEDTMYALHTNLGSITVLDRLTGFGNRDNETGYRDRGGKFWLASGNFDIRDFATPTFGDAVDLIKCNANTCIGV